MLWKKERRRKEGQKKGKQASGWARIPDNSKEKKREKKKNLVKCPPKT